MQRRDFIKAMSALMATPVIGTTEPMTSHDIRWDLFTDPHITRFDLSTPFGYKGRIVGTDGRMLVSIPGNSEGDKERNVPSLSQLPWDALSKTGWTPIGNMKRRSKGDTFCETCFGRGRTGSDVHLCDCDDMCEKCGWGSQSYQGGTKCPDCVHGMVPDGYDLAIGDDAYRASYVGKAKTLGDLEVLPLVFDYPNHCNSKSSYKGGVLAFRFGGNGFGLLSSVGRDSK